MSLDPQVTETVVRIDPVTHVKEVRTEYRESSAGWWTAAFIAVVLILGGVFVLTNHDRQTTRDAIQAAADQGRAEGILDSMGNASDAANAAAATQAAIVTAQAASQAQQAANQAARAADQAAAHASATVAAPSLSDPAPAQ